MDKFPITVQGHARMEAELKKLRSDDRPAVIKAIAIAREHGDLKENAEYHAARDKQSFIEGRIQELEDKTARSEVIDVTTLTGPTIKFGAKVTMMDDETEEEVTYQILSEYEADLKKNRISITAPIARGLIGKEEGDLVTIRTPKGGRDFEVLTVTYEAPNE